VVQGVLKGLATDEYTDNKALGRPAAALQRHKAITSWSHYMDRCCLAVFTHLPYTVSIWERRRRRREGVEEWGEFFSGGGSGSIIQANLFAHEISFDYTSAILIISCPR
jgi:hypothetical protein